MMRLRSDPISRRRRSARLVAAAVLVLLFGISSGVGLGADCNLNGRDDAEEIAAGDAHDCDGDGDPDECEIVELLTGGRSELVAPEPATALAAADLDGDGDLDLVSLGTEQGSLSIWTGGGDGTFSREDVVPGCPGASTLVSADFDGDGVAELALGCPPSSEVRIVSPLELDGATAVFLDAAPTALATGDLDDDGDVDLVVASAEGVVWLENRGENGFAIGGGREGVGTSEPEALEVADIDSDRFLDVVIADPGQDRVTILYGAGGPQFGEVHAVPVEGGPAAVESSDIDLDGDLDLFTVNRETQRVTRLEQVTRHDFAISPIEDVAEPIEAFSLAVGEMNGDGRPDLAVGGTWPSTVDPRHWRVRTLVGLPRGGFASAEDLFAGPVGGDWDRVPVLIAAFDPDELPAVVTPLPGTSRLVVFSLETEGGDDENQDGIPDECGERTFRRADVDANDAVQITDAVAILRHLFTGSVHLGCLRSADVDDSGGLEVTDAVWLLRFLFLKGPAPVPPYPECGGDPTGDGLSCLSYALCE